MRTRLLTLATVVWLVAPLVLGDEAERKQTQLSGVCTDNRGQPVAGATAAPLFQCG